MDDYHKRINQQVKLVEESQRENCLAAGKLIAESVQEGGAAHVFDTGHIIDSELIFRGVGYCF